VQVDYLELMTPKVWSLIVILSDLLPAIVIPVDLLAEMLSVRPFPAIGI